VIAAPLRPEVARRDAAACEAHLGRELLDLAAYQLQQFRVAAGRLELRLRLAERHQLFPLLIEARLFRHRPGSSIVGTTTARCSRAPDFMTDSTFDLLMEDALAEARRARDAGEVPIGAVIAIDGAIVGRGFNRPIGSGDPTAHAEVVAIREAAARVGNYRLTGATLCVTVEPCLMCVGAFVHARIGTVVFGAAEPRSGALVSAVRGAELPGFNHRFEVVGGVREQECRALMQRFFRGKR